MAEDTNDGDPHHTAEEPRVPDIPPIQHTISTPAEAPIAPEAPDSFNFITAYSGPGHWIERLVNLPLHTGFTHATRSLVQVFSYRSPEQWQGLAQSQRDSLNDSAARIINEYQFTPLVHQSAVEDSAPYPSTPATTTPKSEDPFPRAPLPLAYACPEPPTLSEGPPTAIPYAPSVATLAQVCCLNLADKGPWVASSMPCFLGSDCNAQLHICKTYWNGVKDHGDNSACAYGEDGVSHWDSASQQTYVHVRPTYQFENPIAVTKGRRCMCECQWAHSEDGSSEEWEMRNRQHWEYYPLRSKCK